MIDPVVRLRILVLNGPPGGRRNPSVIRDLVTAEVVRAG